MNNNIIQKYVIFLMGPTASGKSKLAMKLRKYLPLEIISVDSALIYKHMNIGTSKPTSMQLLQHPHRLINLKDPSGFYSVAEFRSDALREIINILDMGKIPLLVGGTMFYYYILLHGISNLPQSSILLKEKILYFQKKYNLFSLHEYLSIIDINSAKLIHKNDTQRILRALEVYFLTGKTISELKSSGNISLFPFRVLQFAILPNLKYLYTSIYDRFYNMLEQGFENEVRKLFIRGDLNINLPAIRCIGYRQMWNYLSHNISYNDMINQSITATKNLCKRQITWLKRWKDVYIFDDTDCNILIEKILNIVYAILYRNTKL